MAIKISFLENFIIVEKNKLFFLGSVRRISGSWIWIRIIIHTRNASASLDELAQKFKLPFLIFSFTFMAHFQHFFTSKIFIFLNLKFGENS